MARMIELTTPLGKDVLLFRALHGREELGRLSEFELSALSSRADIDPGGLLGKSVTVKLELLGGGYRYFDGHVTRFTQGGMVGRYYQYRMTARPWLWFLTRTADCRIFQEKTVPEILKEIFADHAMAIFEDGLTGTYAKREYCVQYDESAQQPGKSAQTPSIHAWHWKVPKMRSRSWQIPLMPCLNAWDGPSSNRTVLLPMLLTNCVLPWLHYAPTWK